MAAERMSGATNVETVTKPWGAELTRNVFDGVYEEQVERAKVWSNLDATTEELKSKIIDDRRYIGDSIGLTLEEINLRLEDAEKFSEVFGKIPWTRDVGNVSIDWEEAERMVDFRRGRNQQLGDKTSGFINWRSGYGHPNPTVEKLLEKPKPRKKRRKTKLEIKADYENKIAGEIRRKATDKDRERALNVEAEPPWVKEGFDPFFIESK